MAGDWHSTSSTTNHPTPADPAEPAAPAAVDENFEFRSRRSPIVCRHACVATSQPLATSIGLDFLRRGANAADVAVAVAATLAVVEPCSTGLGGDMFCLYYSATDQKVHAINGSGQAPQALTLERVLEDCPRGEQDFKFSPHAVTVPGAARGWEDTLHKHGSGKFTLAQLLEPAAQLAEEGFPVSHVTAHHWDAGKDQLAMWVKDGQPIPLTVNGSDAPKSGEIFFNPDLARVLRELGAKGADEGFYGGRVGKSIVSAIQKHGGVMTLDDLKNHQSLFPQPISQSYRNVRLWQVPPNGQGIAALIALSGLKHLEDKGLCTPLTPDTVRRQSADTYHALIEMMRLGFADARKYVTCPTAAAPSVEWLLDPTRIGDRAERRFDPLRARCQEDGAIASSDTVSFQVVDARGSAISFVNSNFMGFGTGLVPDECGFSLQNRGFNFSLDPHHANCLVGGKRPYHTIIPAMLTTRQQDDDANDADDDDDACNEKQLLYATLTNMGGFMQPQGHLQLTVNLVAGGMDPQAAIDAPRFCIPQGTRDGVVQMETGIAQRVLDDLERQKGHVMQANIAGHDRSIFGRAQIILKHPKTGVLWAGSDGRADGCALGF